MDSIKQSRQTLACNTADYASRFSRVSLLLLLFLSLAPRAISGAFGEDAVAAQQLYLTMHSAPVDDWCPPCIASEKLLKDSGVDFKKIREPLGQ